MNKVILLGHVGKDPEVRHLDSGVVNAQFSLATNETYKNKDGEKVTNTDWHNIVLWRGLAEVAEKYVKKGQSLLIEGKIRTRSYDDKDGNKKYITEIIADKMEMIGKSDDTLRNDSSEPKATTESAIKDDAPKDTDDLPF